MTEVLDKKIRVQGQSYDWFNQNQFFEWFNQTWDITALLKDLAAGRLRPRSHTFERDFIEGFAQSVLSLTRNSTRETKVFNIFSNVDIAHAMDLPAEALKAPVVVLPTRKGRGILRMDDSATVDYLLADGTHRLTRAYFDDVQTLPAFVLSAAQARKYVL